MKPSLVKIGGACVVAVLVAVAAQAWQAQKQQKQPQREPRPYQQAPDVANARYGPHERNVLDVWKPKSPRPSPLVVYIHGGGFTAGDKTYIPQPLFEQAREAGFAFATLNYRYSTQAPYPAPMEDCARAIQFLRLHAREWNINPKAIASTGGSAGAGISLWMGFHDDMAQPSSDDPVKRQSTRLSAMGVTDAQTSYDPRFVAKLVGEETGRHSALAILFGVRGQDVFKAEQSFRLYEDGSPMTHLSAGDPPAFLYYSREMRPLPVADTGEGIHNPRFGVALKEKMDKIGIECIVRTKADYPGGGQPSAMFRDMIAFFKKYFPGE